MKTKILLSSILVTIVSYHSQAQLKLRAIASFDYSYGFAVGSLKEYIPGKTFDGFQAHWRYFIQRNVSLGLRTGYNNFRTSLPRDVYETNRGTVSAVQTRYFNSAPFIPTAYYYMRSLHYVMPYVGGGLGPYLLRYEKYYGVVPERQGSIRFGLSPEAGIVIPFKRSGLGLILTGRYNHVFYNHQEIEGLNYFEATVSLYFGYPVFDDSFMDTY
jgi:hypothetical protein